MNRFHSSRVTGELIRRIEAEPAVSAVPFATHFPGVERYRNVEIEVGRTVGVRFNRVDVGLFPTFEVPILVGRDFVEGDGDAGSNAVIVDLAIAERCVGAGNALGRRIRFAGSRDGADAAAVEAGPWLEIVGVVPGFTVQNDFDPANPRLFLHMDLANAPTALTLAVRVRGPPRRRSRAGSGTLPGPSIPRSNSTSCKARPTLSGNRSRRCFTWPWGSWP